MVPCSIEGLMKFLNNKKYEPVLQKETNQVYVLFKIENQDFPLFFRIYEGNDLLQMLVFFPIQVRKERFEAIARLLHLLNKEIDLPGFGIDETVGLVYHRIMVPAINHKIEPHLLESYLESVPKICQQFFSTIAGTAMSEMNFDELMKKSLYKGQQ
ncbi:MAG: YbjN domain-containing protein [Parachlamydiaceae bacterium]